MDTDPAGAATPPPDEPAAAAAVASNTTIAAGAAWRVGRSRIAVPESARLRASMKAARFLPAARFAGRTMGTASNVGLLTAPLSLVREPVRLTLRAWELGLSSAAEAARIGAELLEPDRDRPADAAAHGEPWEPEQADDTRPEVVEHEAAQVATAHAAADAPPPVPDELIPDHVDEEPVLVAEAAEEGAEDGAGAELHVEPPWDGYERMTAGDIRDRLAAASATEAAAVELYESTHRSRRSVLDAAERMLRTEPR
jgi:hypothetical protein